VHQHHRINAPADADEQPITFGNHFKVGDGFPGEAA
jgi:hypothetical protein